MPIVCVEAPGGTYWQHWRTYIAAELLRTGMIGPDDMKLFTVTDDIETAVKAVTDFYRRYHSMRYVHDQLVLRMTSKISPALLGRLNSEFADVFMGGSIEQHDGPLPDEHDELPNLPRLTFAFNRRSFGRLRILVNMINDAD